MNDVHAVPYAHREVVRLHVAADHSSRVQKLNSIELSREGQRMRQELTKI